MKSALVLSGEPPMAEFVEAIKLYNFIAVADGGYNWVSKNSIVPSIVLGDMDSNRVLIPENIKKIEFSTDKDLTDGEIAVEYLIKNGYNEIDIFGGGGLRDDHALANLGLLVRAHSKNAMARLITNYSTIYYASGMFKLKNVKNKNLSIVPFCGDVHILNTEGLKYQIVDRTLSYMELGLGISNICTDNNISIDIIRGGVLVFVVS